MRQACNSPHFATETGYRLLRSLVDREVEGVRLLMDTRLSPASEDVDHLSCGGHGGSPAAPRTRIWEN